MQLCDWVTLLPLAWVRGVLQKYLYMWETPAGL